MAFREGERVIWRGGGVEGGEAREKEGVEGGEVRVKEGGEAREEGEGEGEAGVFLGGKESLHPKIVFCLCSFTFLRR